MSTCVIVSALLLLILLGAPPLLRKLELLAYEPELRKLPKLLGSVDPERASQDLFTVFEDQELADQVRRAAGREILHHGPRTYLARLMCHRDVLAFDELIGHVLASEHLVHEALEATMPEWSEIEDAVYLKRWYAASAKVRAATLALTCEHIA